MIKINNTIESEITAQIFRDGQFFGECLNELAFLDLRNQIRLEQAEGFEFRMARYDRKTGNCDYTEKTEILSDGSIDISKVSDMYWDRQLDLLCRLLSCDNL